MIVSNIAVGLVKPADILYQAEHPYWRLRPVYILRDPRARLADMKNGGKYMSGGGRIREYTNRTYKQVGITITDRWQH